MAQRANALAERLEQGADALTVFAKSLSDEEWQRATPKDGRTVDVIVHDVASVYPLSEWRQTMRKTVLALTVSILAGVVLVAQQSTTPKPAAKTSAGDQAKIRQAMSAAPADIAKNAAVIEMDAKGQMKPLRAGTNGWTCMVSTGGKAGAAGAEDPMCLDKTWMGWADAWMNKKDPQVTSMGIGYMLRGDKGASNTDPYATAPTATNQWVVSPSHIMVLVPDPKMLDALPTDPHIGGAWVMWKGTKYAHIMVPTAVVPKTVATTAKP